MISFLLPAYKSQHLSESIDSILNQSYNDFELIIVNDASTDDIDFIVDQYEDARIRYYKNKENIGNHNLVAQWNHCLSYAKGDWVIMASDDDIYDPLYLEEMVRLSVQYPQSTVFHCNIYGIDEESNIVSIAMPCGREETGLEHIYFRQIRGRLHAFQEFMLSTHSLLNHGGYPEFPCATATDLVASVVVAGDAPIICSDKYLFKWRNNGNNISSSPKTALARIDACEKAVKWCLEYGNSVSAHTELEYQILKTFENDIVSSFKGMEKYLVNIMNTTDVKYLIKQYDHKEAILLPKSYLYKNLLVRMRNKILPWKYKLR